MTPADYDFICTEIRKRSGLVLTADKTYLVESRLMPIVRRQGYDTLGAFIGALRADPKEDLMVAVTEAMTTNESFFFRDKTPFDQFRDVMMPNIVQNRPAGQPIRLWSAAASTGQEPYSLRMILNEKPALSGGRQVDILGTDLSQAVLEKANQGIYSQFEVQRGLPIQLLVKYFKKDGDVWRITPELRSSVTFRQFNLMDDFKPLGQFDIVFCRNVLIYFDVATKKAILDRIAVQLAPDGYLVVGAAETVFGITNAFKLVDGQRGLYVRDGVGRAASVGKVDQQAWSIA